ncbi:MAG: beta-ketoacyl synthase chain length factor [Deltaproteobacteria bacterium]|nr:beta-ketoacyl synthase chain length factor [Deltaproteobacteria bacterium]MBW2394833.1 beta-ketoacyl synthase chain length factor [Deltaproteobacteria bacterium]
MKTVLRSWCAWSPGLETAEQWTAWAKAPQPLASEGVPDARFLPAMLRRRCTPLSKILLKVARDGCNEAERSQARTVFASRHGSINESIGLLENVARGERISPATFSHTVHNAQAGLFSIAMGNRQASSSLAGREDSFGSGLLEALGHLEREPERPVLFVMGDVPLDPVFASLLDEPACAYGVALLLARSEGKDEESFEVALERPPPDAKRLAWPPAAEFLRLWIAGSTSFSISTSQHLWRFTRQE